MNNWDCVMDMYAIKSMLYTIICVYIHKLIQKFANKNHIQHLKMFTKD